MRVAPEVSPEAWRAFAKELELIDSAWASALAKPAVRRRFALAAWLLQIGAVAEAVGRHEDAELLGEEFARQIDRLTDVCAEVAPALLVGYGGLSGLREFVGIRAGKVMAARLKNAHLDHATDDLMLDVRIRPPGSATDADLYAALGRKRPRGRPAGAEVLGQSRAEVEERIRTGLADLRREHRAVTHRAIAEAIGVGDRTLRRAIEFWQIDLPGLKLEAGVRARGKGRTAL